MSGCSGLVAGGGVSSEASGLSGAGTSGLPPSLSTFSASLAASGLADGGTSVSSAASGLEGAGTSGLVLSPAESGLEGAGTSG